MELFYHVSRDIELPSSRRRARRGGGSRTCEACGVELEGTELSEGGTFGLSFCADCRDRLDRSAIQIHFCDACGVSVPLYAVEGGVALTREGQILCQRCLEPGRGSRAGLIVLLAVVALAAMALGALLAAG